MTSGQYKYLIFKKMQNYVSCDNNAYRLYLHDFFLNLFQDESLIIDEVQYLEFCEQMDKEANYMKENDLRSSQSVYDDGHFENFEKSMNDLFNTIGITVTMTMIENGLTNVGYAPEEIHFHMPSGEIRTIKDIDANRASVNFCTGLYCNDLHLKQILPFYLWENEGPKDIADEFPNPTGFETNWTYNEKQKTVWVYGDGALPNFNVWEYIGLKDIETIFIDSGITNLLYGSIANTGLNVVDGHGELDDLVISPLANFIKPNYTAYPQGIVLYSDNKKMREHDWGMAIEMHPLSDWGKAWVLDKDWPVEWNVSEVLENEKFTDGNTIQAYKVTKLILKKENLENSVFSVTIDGVVHELSANTVIEEYDDGYLSKTSYDTESLGIQLTIYSFPTQLKNFPSVGCYALWALPEGVESAQFSVTGPDPIAFVYGGKQFAPIPEENRNTYPYAYIGIDSGAFGGGELYRAWFTDKPLYQSKSLGLIMVPDAVAGKIYSYSEDEKNWNLTEEWDSTGSPFWTPGSELWSDYDIENDDGDIVLKASDPVPIYE